MNDRLVSDSTTIDAPPAVVFAIVADPRQHPRIDGSGSLQGVITGPERLSAKGDTFGMDMKLFGLPYKIRNKVVELEEDRRIAWRHFGGAPLALRARADRRRRHPGHRDLGRDALHVRRVRGAARGRLPRAQPAGHHRDAGAAQAGRRGRAGPMTDAVPVERTGPVTTVVLSRPERRNAVDGPTAAALAAAFRAFDADEAASVAVLYGAGGTFCAGADLQAIGTAEQNRVEPDGDGPMGPTRLRLGKPVIAAISGHAVAGGLELALWCDLRVAEESAVLGVFCRRWGVPLVDGGTVRLPRLIGAGRAMDLVLTGRPVGADEALAIGLVDRVVPDGTARAAAEALAAQVAAFPQTCLRQDRLVPARAGGARRAVGAGERAPARPRLARGRHRRRRRAVPVRRGPARLVRLSSGPSLPKRLSRTASRT